MLQSKWPILSNCDDDRDVIVTLSSVQIHVAGEKREVVYSSSDNIWKCSAVSTDHRGFYPGWHQLAQSGGGEGGGRDQGGALDTPYIYCEGGQDGGLGGHQLVGGGK